MVTPSSKILQSSCLKVTLAQLDVSLEKELEKYWFWRSTTSNNLNSNDSLDPPKPEVAELIFPDSRDDDADLANLINDLSNDLSMDAIDIEDEFQEKITASTLTLNQQNTIGQPIDQNSNSPQSVSSAKSKDFEEKTGNILSPLGIISVILLLVSSAVIGYLLIDPSGLNRMLKLNSDPKPRSSSADIQPAQNSSIPLDTSKSSNSNQIPFVSVPDKSSKSVPTLLPFSPSNFSIRPYNPIRVISKASSSPNVLPQLADDVPSAIAPIANPPSMLPLPSQVKANPPALNSSPRNITSTTGTQTEANQIPAPQDLDRLKAPDLVISEPKSIPESSSLNPSDKGYQVTVDNSYLLQAQQIQQDAFVRPSDGKVQVGSFQNVETAQKIVNDLSQQGIPAKVE